ncbi:MAG: phosphoenolpyruvate synthase, partial [Dehalococcoidia bacterium]
MPAKPKAIAWFEEVAKKDIPLVGGKGANLGELTKAHIPVPPGFIVTAQAYYYFLDKSKLRNSIQRLLAPLDPSDSKKLQEVASEIKGLITQAAMPPEIAGEITVAYSKLGGGLVAVRSSATAEDLPEASFAGQQRTFLNIEGEKEVVAAVQQCWSSLFEPRAIFYRHQHGFDHFKVGIAVPVQRMVQSNISGVMFTIEPLSSDKSKIVIEAVFGLGEAIVSREVTPDLYIIDKKQMKIIDKKIGRQEWELVRNPMGWRRQTEPNIKVTLLPHNQIKQKLGDEAIADLARLGKDIEGLYSFPQDIEWAKDGDGLFIVQTRPVTTLKEKGIEADVPELQGTVLLSGMAASPGISTGSVKTVHQATEIDKVEEGDVLVAEKTNPDFVPAMKRAVAIVTDSGGRTSHAAIVSRELGLPCVVGTELATQTLKDGQMITVDGSRGKVYEGKLIEEKIVLPAARARGLVKTHTKVYVNLAEPELAETVAARDVDGIGLLRAEFMIAQIGEHPLHMIAENRSHEFVEQLAQGLATFARAFDPRPVVFRTTDFKTNEYRNLKGGENYEQVEENPMLGYRGC